MSSNAFARSRPRVRHQRVPRTHSCDHPRFVQLVNELTRLNDLKKKQEEAEIGRLNSSANEDETNVGMSNTNSGAQTNGNTCSNSSSSSSSSCSSSSSSSSCAGGTGGGGSSSGGSSTSSGIHNICITCNGSRNTTGSSMNICSGLAPIGSRCCNLSTTSSNGNNTQTLNGYRSLNATSSLHLNESYHHQQQNHHHQHVHNHHHTQNHQINQLLHHQAQHNQQHHYHQHEPHNLVQQHQQQSDDRCTGKSSTSSFGYSKQNLVVEQTEGNSSFSNNNDSNLDLRQDENRSKRKRSSNESSNSRKNSMSSCGATGGASKRHKSMAESTRPLSPSFTKCPICLLDCMDRDPSFTNTCFHLFCYVCIENWTKNKATCPLCRTKFTKIIYNIKSSTNYEEKVASPIRRDDDDGYIADRFMLEHISNLNSNSAMSSRNANSDEVQFLFENLSRNSEVLIPPYFVNQIDPRQGESLHSFNSVTTPANFNSNVPHPPFPPAGYPMPPTFVGTLLQPNRIAPMTSTAITSAYNANTSLSNMNNESRRRSGRFVYPRTNYEPQTVDNTGRVTRTLSAATIQTPGGELPIPRHNVNQHAHQHHLQIHHHPHHNQHNQHRTTNDMARHNQRLEQSHTSQISLAYPIQARYNQPNVSYPRRQYNSQQEHQHILDHFYRQMPDT